MQYKKIYYLLLVALPLISAIITLTPNLADAQTPPAPTGYSFENCKIILGKDKKIPNKQGIARANGQLPDKIVNAIVADKNNYLSINFKPASGIKYNDQNINAYVLENTGHFSALYGSYYLFLDDHEEPVINPGTGLVTGSKFILRHYIIAPDKDGKMTKVNGSGFDTFIRNYFDWMNNDSNECQADASDPSNTHDFISQSLVTIQVEERVPGSSTPFSNWYYVAHGNYRKSVTSEHSCRDDILGYVFRNEDNKRYFVVKPDGTFIAQYDETKEHEWKCEALFTKIAGWHEPRETKNRLQILNVAMDFTSQKDVPEIKAENHINGKNITLEINLDGPFGPSVNKNIGSYGRGDTDKMLYAFGEFTDDIYIASKDDFYFITSAEFANHLPHLISKVVLCAHKPISADANGAPYLMGQKEFNVLDKATGQYGSSDLRKVDTAPNRIQWYQADEAGAKFNGKVEQTQTCGSGEDESIGDVIAKDLTKAIPTINQLIFDALKAVGTMIQNFIIYIVQLAISLASSAIPI